MSTRLTIPTVACGMISQYNISDPDKRYGVKNLGAVVGKRLKMQGFIVSDANMGPKYAADHQKNVAMWISDGTFKAQQSVTVGIDNAVKGFLGMLNGENFGKSVLTIEDMEVSLDSYGPRCKGDMLITSVRMLPFPPLLSLNPVKEKIISSAQGLCAVPRRNKQC